MKMFEAKVSEQELRKTGYHVIRTNEVEVTVEMLDIADMVLREITIEEMDDEELNNAFAESIA